MATSLRRHQRRTLALQLIQRQLRTTPIYLLTGLPEGEIRALYRMVHGKSPPSGPAPMSASLFPTRRAQIRVSVFAALYCRIGTGAVLRNVDPETLMKSYDLFQEFSAALGTEESRDRFDFTDAWVVARDLRSGIAVLKHCRACRVGYLVAEGSDLPPTCPYCALRKERKRLRCRKADPKNPGEPADSSKIA